MPSIVREDESRSGYIDVFQTDSTLLTMAKEAIKPVVERMKDFLGLPDPMPRPFGPPPTLGRNLSPELFGMVYKLTGNRYSPSRLNREWISDDLVRMARCALIKEQNPNVTTPQEKFSLWRQAGFEVGVRGNTVTAFIPSAVCPEADQWLNW